MKDAFHTCLVAGNREAVNPSQTGTKAAAHYRLKVAAGGHEEIRLRLCTTPPARPFSTFDDMFSHVPG